LRKSPSDAKAGGDDWGFAFAVMGRFYPGVDIGSLDEVQLDAYLQNVNKVAQIEAQALGIVVGKMFGGGKQ